MSHSRYCHDRKERLKSSTVGKETMLLQIRDKTDRGSRCGSTISKGIISMRMYCGKL